MENIPQVIAAATEYRKRRDRQSHPDGRFDSAGRWYPSAPELKECCNSVREPSRGFPYSYMTHCRTAKHVAHLFGVNATDLKRMANTDQTIGYAVILSEHPNECSTLAVA
jgi:hypothetical protein